MRPNLVQTAPHHHCESNHARIESGGCANVHNGKHKGTKYRAVLRVAGAALAQLQPHAERGEALVFNTGASRATIQGPMKQYLGLSK